MKSSIDNSVNLGGKQDVTGLKEFSADVAADDLNDTARYNVLVKCDSVDNAVAPSSAVDYGGIEFRDKNDLRFAKVEVGHTSDDVVQCKLSASRVINGTFEFAGLGVGLNANGKKTIDIGQNYRGSNPAYYKVPTNKAGLFLLVCFGSSIGSATFPLAYTSTPCIVCSLVTDGDAGYCSYVGKKSTTSFTILRHGITAGEATANWIAIGFRQE